MVAQLPQGGGQGETAKAQEEAAQIRGLLKAGELEPKAVKIAACWGLRSAQLALNVPHHSFALWGTPKQTLRSMADAEIPRPVLTRLCLGWLGLGLEWLTHALSAGEKIDPLNEQLVTVLALIEGWAVTPSDAHQLDCGHAVNLAGDLLEKAREQLGEEAEAEADPGSPVWLAEQLLLLAGYVAKGESSLKATSGLILSCASAGAWACGFPEVQALAAKTLLLRDNAWGASPGAKAEGNPESRGERAALKKSLSFVEKLRRDLEAGRLPGESLNALAHASEESLERLDAFMEVADWEEVGEIQTARQVIRKARAAVEQACEALAEEHHPDQPEDGGGWGSHHLN